MKKNYSMLALGALLFFGAGSKLSAQALSGTVTINSAQATGGTNYQTFNALASALNSNGISGALVVDVVANSGPYNEQVQFNQIVGASATSPITINGNNNLLTFNSSNFAQPHVMFLNGTDFLVVNNLQMSGTGSYAFVLDVVGSSNNNTFTACSFSVQNNIASTAMIPIMFSGNQTSYSTLGQSCSNNAIMSCTTSGGYFGISMYGNSSAPFPTNNRIEGCSVNDFYLYGAYIYYGHKKYTIRNNHFRRPNRTNTSTCAGIYGYYSDGALIEGNKISNLFDMLLTSTSTCYGIYWSYNWHSYAQGQPTNEEIKTTIRNNVIFDIRHNGALYGMLCYYPDAYIYHNTISLDYTLSTSGSVTYGFLGYGATQYPLDFRNNLITINRGGSGTKYGYYASGVTGGTIMDKNNIYVGATAGTNYYGYWTGLANNLAAFQQQGANQNGYSIDPQYANLANYDFTPTNLTMDNGGASVGVFFDHNGFVRNQTTPDVGAIEFNSPICASTPTNTIAGPNYSLCPGETANFMVNNLTADLGITYQWQMSTVSNVGPFTPISGATSFSLTAPNQTTQAWYSAVITCTAAGGGSVAPVWQVNIAGPTTSQVPYWENFEGIGLNNRLPNCSWLAPGIGSSAGTFTSAQSGNRLPLSGSSYATFNATQTTPNHYYTNAIQLNAGITYSASVWYQSDLTGATNWSDLSILVGPNQSTTGLTSICSTGGPAVSAVYKSLSGTFTVATSGTYYVAVRGTASAGTAQFLTFDDLRIEIPCTVASNQPSVAITAANATICTGNNAVLTANGADMYSWAPNGATTAINNDQPSTTTTYTVTGTNTLTGCSSKNSIKVTVRQSPNITGFAMPPIVCEGKTSNLTASGASTYTWAVGGTGAVKTVTVTGAANYSVIGTGTNGCQSSAVVAVSSIPSPTVTANASSQIICVGETVTLTANGATTYNWQNSNPATLLIGGNLSFYGSTPAVYSWMVTGMNEQGCEGSATVNLTVDACAGISEASALNGISVFPNPTSGVVTVIASNGNNRAEVLDITGRVVLSQDLNSNNQIDLSTFASGVYHLRVSGNGAVSMTKIVKQ